MDQQKPGIWSRRDFFSRVGWCGISVFSFLSLVGFLRSAFPRVLFQPPSTFKAGFPSDYTVGEVSDKSKQDYRVWIVREDEGFYALFAKCTHLGCTPNWLQAQDKFKCPCHGSGYYPGFRSRKCHGGAFWGDEVRWRSTIGVMILSGWVGVWSVTDHSNCAAIGSPCETLRNRRKNSGRS